ncbi:MAG: hypothetical protein LUH82_02550 [Clostridiales bacterium]|nr:hypothetical protein [Clostridiales bacterium]
MLDENNNRLDSPLVVHKATDASYADTAGTVDIESTHIDDEDKPTLERHRYKKVKKKSRAPYILIAVILIAALFVGLYYGGVFTSNEEKTTEAVSKSSYTTTEENKFEGIITVKGTYVFFEGEEVDGIKGLERCIKYLDAGTHFTVQDEKADSSFLNNDIVSLLQQYDIDYDIEYIVSSGLTSQYE